MTTDQKDHTAMTAPQQYDDANSILMGGGGAPTAKFEFPGTTIGGRIVGPPKAFQERDYNRVTKRSDGAPKVFPSGDPIMGITVDVQTTGLAKVDADDTGVRRVYIQGKRLKDAVRDGIRSAGAPGLEVGGELHVTYTGDGEPAGAGVSPPKLYSVRYVPTGATAANAVLGVNTATGEVPNEWNQPPTPATVAAPAPVVSTPAGVDPAVAAALAALSPEQRAAMGLPPV